MAFLQGAALAPGEEGAEGVEVGRAQMLTAHASKGLEFEAVFMVHPSTLSSSLLAFCFLDTQH